LDVLVCSALVACTRCGGGQVQPQRLFPGDCLALFGRFGDVGGISDMEPLDNAVDV
jgi:hypothetical protein